uniref:Cytochrome c oxidase assembly factor 6 n=1 Tax=Scleropages formosus TaxID=113540 RepID=A0A8C9QT21_SCLFO
MSKSKSKTKGCRVRVIFLCAVLTKASRCWGPGLSGGASWTGGPRRRGGATGGRSIVMEASNAPNALQRRACWAARDELWRCLDEKSDDDAALCDAFRKVFEAKCPAQWVKYFNKRRDFLKFKEKINSDGFEPSS